MSSGVQQPPGEPPSTTAMLTHTAYILDLATEMIQGVCEWLDLDNLKAVRLTCKELRDKSLYHFGTTYFRALRTIVSRRALKNLVAVSSQDLGSYVQYLSIVSQPVNESHCYCQVQSSGLSTELDSDDSNFDDHLEPSDEVKAFLYLLDEQRGMEKDGSDVCQFVKAFTNFTNLKIVQLCYLFTEETVGDPSPAVGKTMSLQRQWASEDFDQYESPRAHLITPFKRSLKAEAVVDRMKLEIEQFVLLSLHPLNDVVVEALEKSDRQTIQVDVTVSLSPPFSSWDADFEPICSSLDSWNHEPFDLATTSWRRLAERHLRSLVIHAEYGKLCDMTEWTSNLLRVTSVSERLEEFRFSHLYHHRDRILDLSAFHWRALKHLTINDTGFSRVGELHGLLSDVGPMLEDITLENVNLYFPGDSWTLVLECLEQMLRLSLVHLRNLRQETPALVNPLPNTGQQHLRLRGKEISPGLKLAVSKLRLGQGLFWQPPFNMAVVHF
ncbi:hypothetical protein BU16DRAFT_540272 [Lophium mytilinum]|uniref:F-box domain-containing protein n=1 Tax=Lophium mytilinum TaxID=390894 RepID=A0A6A6QPR9_9PEZI|nr:hypothetical protein BU16DRAFT_540272 [Lophium mytilinum]